MNIDSNDIIEYVLGHAGPELRRDIESRASADPAFAAELAQWQSLRHVLAAERRLANQITDSATARVAESIRRMERAPEPKFSLRQWWWELTHPAMALTAAACALLIIGVAWMAVNSVNRAEFGKAIASSIYVDFSASHEGQGTANQPFRSLDKGASSVAAGGTLNLKPGATADPVRISKPMRLTAPEGPVRIGKI
ncbi:hypothetical protein LLG95_03390 [bacterium]|nr:hypothetical protein [bacterium]